MGGARVAEARADVEWDLSHEPVVLGQVKAGGRLNFSWRWNDSWRWPWTESGRRGAIERVRRRSARETHALLKYDIMKIGLEPFS